jgi:ankyrin repeat protein
MNISYHPVELLRAIHRAESDLLKEMLAYGADINAQSDGWSPAMQACGDGQIKCLRILIAAGADLNASGERGMTPLMVAAMEDEKPCLVALLNAGVDLEKKDHLGHTAAGFAAAYGTVECLARLLKAGAELDACVAGSVDPSCVDALAAERARREKIALAKSAPKPKLSVKAPRM